MPDLASLSVKAAFNATAANTAAITTDITPYVKLRLRIERPRSSELERPQPARLALTLDNSLGHFDPDNSASPFYPYVDMGKKVRVDATWAGVTYGLFVGQFVDFPQDRQSRNVSLIEVEAFDFMAGLAETDLWKGSNKSWPAERSDLRVGRILDTAGWPAGARNLLTGQTTVAARDITEETSALEELYAVMETEMGNIFVDAVGDFGRFNFQNRHYRISNFATSLGLFSDEDSPGGLPYARVTLDRRGLFLKNEIVVTRIGGTVPGFASDTASVDAYRPRTLNRETQLNSDLEAQDMAGFLLSRYSTPAERPKDLLLMPQRWPAFIWPQVLSRLPGDRITWAQKPRTNAPITVDDAYIESVVLDFTPGFASCLWGLSPADPQTYWVLNASALDVNTRPGY